MLCNKSLHFDDGLCGRTGVLTGAKCSTYVKGKGFAMKRTTVFAVSAVLALSLVGCATGESKSDNSAESQTKAIPSASEASQQDSQSSKAASESYRAVWADDAPEPFGGADSLATPGELSIVQRGSGEYCLVLKMEYRNDSDTGANLINDSGCKVSAYQGGIELDKPGIASESGAFDYADAFTRVKDGASVSTELVWVLRDTESPVELDFGKDANYKPLFSKDVSIEKVE